MAGITCNGVGRYRLEADEPPFDYVILDEVCKAIFSGVMIAAAAGGKGDAGWRSVAVAADVLSGSWTCRRRSRGTVHELFERVRASCKAFLNLHYPMTDEIGGLISREFYQGRLENGARRSDADSLVWLDNVTEQNDSATRF